MISKQNYHFYFLLIILAIFLYFFIDLIKNFVIAITFGAFFAILSYPFYNWLNNKFNFPNFNSFVVVGFISFLAVSTLTAVSFFLIKEITNMINNIDFQVLQNMLASCQHPVCEKAQGYKESLVFNYEALLIKFKGYITSSIYYIFSALGTFIINLFIFLLSYFYLLRDGKSFLQYLKSIIPLEDKEKEAFYEKFRKVVTAVFGDTLLIAFIQGALVGIMFWILGLPAPVLWTFVATFFALIPTLGSGIVWVPAVIYLAITQQYISAGILLAWGMLAVGLIDNFLRPLLIRSKIKIHSLIVFISILGGIQQYNVFGIFLGPIIASVLITILKFYKEETKYLMK